MEVSPLIHDVLLNFHKGSCFFYNNNLLQRINLGSGGRKLEGVGVRKDQVVSDEIQVL
jgi:hypothetical protein